MNVNSEITKGKPTKFRLPRDLNQRVVRYRRCATGITEVMSSPQLANKHCTGITAITTSVWVAGINRLQSECGPTEHIQSHMISRAIC